MSTIPDKRAPDGAFDDHFGVCPECGKHDGYINVGPRHWFYCAEHRIKWFVGSNLFSSWREETEEEQRAQYERIGLGGFTKVEPRFTAIAVATEEDSMSPTTDKRAPAATDNEELERLRVNPRARARAVRRPAGGHPRRPRRQHGQPGDQGGRREGPDPRRPRPGRLEGGVFV